MMENDIRKKENLCQDIITETMASSVSKNIPIETSVSEKYVRANYEDSSALKKYKEDVFDGKKTIKNEYGEGDIHKEHKAAKNKYKGNASLHQAEIDHTVPIKNTYDVARNMRYITDEDICDAVNRKHNFKAIDKHTNSSKKEKTNWQYVKEKSELQGKVKMKMIKDGIVAGSLVYGELLAKDLARSGMETARGAVEDVLVTSTAIQMEAVIQGEKSVPEAVIDTATSVIKGEINAAALGTGIELATFTIDTAKVAIDEIHAELVKTIGQESAKKIICETVSKGLEFVSEHTGDIVTCAMLIGDVVSKYTEGGMTEEELIKEVASKAAVKLSMNVGKKIGGELGEIVLPQLIKLIPGGGTVIDKIVPKIVYKIVGEIVGSMVGYIVGTTVVSTLEEKKLIAKQQAKINRLCREAIEAMENSKIALRDIVEAELDAWDDNFEKGFQNIYDAAISGNVELFSEGLNKLLTAFNAKCRFSTLDEFDGFFYDDSQSFRLGGES